MESIKTEICNSSMSDGVKQRKYISFPYKEQLKWKMHAISLSVSV